MKPTNRGNQAVYRLWSPIYDAIFSNLFRPGRARAMALLAPRRGERVLLVGVGTGADLPLLPEGVRAVGVDLSGAMLTRARTRLPVRGCDVALGLADAQHLPFEDASFDAVILNLVLSVVPDPRYSLAEAMRVLRAGGRVVIFDKFVPDGTTPTLSRRMGNTLTTLLGTDITRRLGDILVGMPCEIICDEPGLLGGGYRVVLLRRA